jgi:hypothetical protein
MMNPFFIVGVSRSGTSYLYDLLNSHPQIRLSYEGRLFTEGWHCYNSSHDLKSDCQFNPLLDELIRCDQHEPLNSWLGDVITHSRDTLFKQYTRNPSFEYLIELIYQLPGQTDVWGNKMLRMEMAKEILTHWPGAKFIVLVRDPRAVFASQKRFFPHRRLKYSCIYWNLHTELIRDSRLPEDQFLILRYEDFVEDAPKFLERILKHAEIKDQSAAEKMLETHPSSPKSIDRWRTDLTEKEIHTIESICFTNMQQYGYQPTLVKEGIKLNILTKVIETVLDNKSRFPVTLSDWKKKNVLKRFWMTIR